MPKQLSTAKRPEIDENTRAKRVIDDIIEFTERAAPLVKKNPAAVSLGRLGGLKGGKARAEKLSKARRSEIASNAAKTRWQNQAK